MIRPVAGLTAMTRSGLVTPSNSRMLPAGTATPLSVRGVWPAGVAGTICMPPKNAVLPKSVDAPPPEVDEMESGRIAVIRDPGLAWIARVHCHVTQIAIGQLHFVQCQRRRGAACG